MVTSRPAIDPVNPDDLYTVERRGLLRHCRRLRTQPRQPRALVSSPWSGPRPP